MSVGSPFRSSLSSLVAGRADDPHHLGDVVAGVRDAVRRRASVVDAVAAARARGARRRARAGRAPSSTTSSSSDSPCEYGSAPDRTADSSSPTKTSRWLSGFGVSSLFAPRTPNASDGRSARRSTRGRGGPLGSNRSATSTPSASAIRRQRRDARVRTAALHLAEEALADSPERLGNRPERAAPQAPDRAQPLTDVDLHARRPGRSRESRSPEVQLKEN